MPQALFHVRNPPMLSALEFELSSFEQNSRRHWKVILPVVQVGAEDVGADVVADAVDGLHRIPESKPSSLGLEDLLTVDVGDLTGFADQGRVD